MYYEQDSSGDCHSGQVGSELIGKPPAAPVLDGLINQRPAKTFSGDPHRVAALGEERDQVARPPRYLNLGSNNCCRRSTNEPFDLL